MKYEAVIGLEVHVHLATKSKLFCSCSTKFGQAPNTNVCEVCAGMPGALPVPNREAIHLAALAGLATGCNVNLVSRFARKNYFYPDLPSGYQISQFELPICEHGSIQISSSRGNVKIGITRIHMENDAGKNIHSSHENISFVDLNRAGTPLVEIVSEPDLRSAEEAVEYLRQLHRLVTYLGISDGNMEEGSFRCDANVSIRPAGDQTLGTRTELKNLNSFRHVQKAIEYEIERQEDLLEAGGKIEQETRLYDSVKNITASMRNKEEAHDYRYFPDPDLLPVEIAVKELEEWRESLPELPQARSLRFCSAYGLNADAANFLIQNRPLADFFEKAAGKAEAKKICDFIMGPLARICNEQNLPLDPTCWKLEADTLAELVELTGKGVISTKIAADIFPEIFSGNEKPAEFVKSKGLAQISDADAIEKAVSEVLAANPAEVEAYRAGKTKLMAFFTGQVMRIMKGKANPAIVNQLLTQKLK